MHPIRTIKNIYRECIATVKELAAAIREHTRISTDLRADLAAVKEAVSYLARAERHHRESHGHRADF